VTDPSARPPEGGDDPSAAAGAEPPTCYRHPDREAHIRCVRCNRRICPDCMIDASVGFQCPECVREGNRGVRQARTTFGGRVTGDPGYVSKALIGLNVLAYVVQLAGGRELELRFFLVGALPPPPLEASLGVADGEFYRLLTSAFMHGGVLHLALNMFAIYLFGPPLESALGRTRFTTLYLLSALGGSAASYAFSAPNQASLGASGAVFGLLGAFLVVTRRLGRDTSGVLVLLGVNLVFGFVVDGIDWRAHLGGLVAGGLAALALVYAPRRGRALVQVGGLLVVLVAVLAVVALRTAALVA
jgi:membrane associated rhomboid family serine protease